jgi:acetoin utilization deacetylase AcuC-like enzyme
VAIIDFDVHHGNGTQAAFYRDPTVLYVSSHQYPYYPGTGAATETGEGPGLGFTLNLPLPAGAGDTLMATLYDGTVLPAVSRFRPDLILVSAGFDAHERDPLGGLRATTEGFTRLMGTLNETAAATCGGRIAYVTEGGYDLEALRECLTATLQ